MQSYTKTPVRDEIYKLIKESGVPVSAMMIFDKLTKKRKTLNKTTVYRDLDLFKKLGMVRELMFQDSVIRYELAGGNCHHHLVCNNCGKIQDFTINESNFFDTITVGKDFQITGHLIELFGICKTCHRS